MFSNSRDQDLLDGTVLPALEEAGVEPVETGIVDAPADDQAAMLSNVQTIGERFQAADADTIVIVGASGQDWPTYMGDNTDYRPKLLFLDFVAPRAFYTNEATTDTSVLDGSTRRRQLRAGPSPVRRGGHAGVHPDPRRRRSGDTVARGIGTDDPSNQPYQAAFQACPDVDLTRAWLEAAGEDLNYGTLEAAADGLEVHVSGDPATLTFGPPPAADGNPQAYLFEWDPDAQNYALIEG